MKHVKFINIILILLIIAYVATLACCTDDGRLARGNDAEVSEPDSDKVTDNTANLP